MSKEIYEVKCPKNINREIVVEATVPGSKSITNRALLIAAMANGTSTLNGCLTSDDARHFLECIKDLGFPVEETSDGKLGSNIRITGFGGTIPNKKATIYVGSAGTAARFLVAMLAFSDGEYTVNSSLQMKKRPMQPLIDTLRASGAIVTCLEEEGHFPMHIVGAKDKGNIPDAISVNIDKSSQFLSALLISAGALGKKLEIDVTGSHGLSYVDLTISIMNSFAVSVEKRLINEQVKYIVSDIKGYNAIEYDIEPDMSAAAYFYALAAILGAKVYVKGVSRKMLQGDVAFIDVLRKMGCNVVETKDGLEVHGREEGSLLGDITVDMSAFSDQALTLAAIAPFAGGRITINGIGHIRVQECDRINAIVSNLRGLGIEVEEDEDSVTIYPGQPAAGEIETYDDHRVAMSFALTGLRAEGIVIKNPDCCKKTFAEYFDILDGIIMKLMN